jgi:hypothetical protein
MIRHGSRLLVLASVFIVSSACKDERQQASADSLAALPPAVALPAPVPNTGWSQSEAGPVMVLSDAAGVMRAAVVIPSVVDSTMISSLTISLDSLTGMPVELFDRTGAAGQGTLRMNSQPAADDACSLWPGAIVEGAAAQWRVGFRKGVAKPLPLDSLEGAAPADSSRITTELARLASALSVTGDPVFQGLPFIVRKAYWFDLGSTRVLVGDVVRKINEEANPREEHILMIAERASADAGYVTAFHSRVAGSEDVVRTNDILAAVRFINGDTPAVVVSFDYEEGSRVALMQRAGARSWKTTWRSAYTGC